MRHKTISLRVRLFWAFTLVTLVAVMLPVYFFHDALYQDRIEAAEKEALTQASVARSMLESDLSQEQAENLFTAAAKLSFRMTLMEHGGTVIHDSHISGSELSTLDNHRDRPEIEAARATGSGVSLRFSNTLGFEAVYAAVALKNGAILRVAMPLADIRTSLEHQYPTLIAVAVGVMLFCLFFSAFITGKVRKHMGDLAEIVACISRDTGKRRRRLRDVRWREMLPLANAVNRMADTIEAHVDEITDKQEQLQTILNSMNEGILVLGAGGEIRHWNRALSKMFPHIAQTKGKPVIECIPLPSLQSRVDALLAGVDAPPADNGEHGRLAEEAIHFEMPAGRFLVASVSRPSTRNDSLGAVIVIHDATEMMRLECVRRDFVSNVSHELRTPLTAIAGYSETLAASDDLDERYKSFAAIIHKHAVSLAGIISDLLALSRIENTQESIPLTAMYVDPVVHDAAAGIRGQADAKNIDIRIDLAPMPVLANTSLLAKVFRNLLENACRYSPQSGVVQICSRHEGDRILFCVSDNGPGIPAKALPRIFERFYQVKKERNSGTAGIGLAICKHIIERHNGRIWAQSPYGEAATAMLFTLQAATPEK